MTCTRSLVLFFQHTTTAALLLASLGTQAASFPAGFSPAPSDSLLSAQASFSNLRYTLIDLDPNDNITPSITFTTAGVFQSAGTVEGALSAPQPTATLNIFGVNAHNTGGGTTARMKINDAIAVTTPELLPATEHSIVDPDGLSAAVIGNNYVTNGSKISNSDVSALKASFPPSRYLPETNPANIPTWEIDTTSISSVGGNDSNYSVQSVSTDLGHKWVLVDSMPPPIDGRHRFELSAKTAVRFEGTLSTSAALQLSNATFPTSTEDVIAIAKAYGFMSVQLYELPEGHATEWLSYADFVRDLQLQTKSSDASAFYMPRRMTPSFFPLQTQLDLTNSRTEDLSVYFSNDGANVAIGTVYLESMTTVSLDALPASVPEPSSNLLMTLGLLSLGATASLRRQSSMPNS